MADLTFWESVVGSDWFDGADLTNGESVVWSDVASSVEVEGDGCCELIAVSGLVVEDVLSVG